MKLAKATATALSSKLRVKTLQANSETAKYSRDPLTAVSGVTVREKHIFAPDFSCEHTAHCFPLFSCAVIQLFAEHNTLIKSAPHRAIPACLQCGKTLFDITVDDRGAFVQETKVACKRPGFCLDKCVDAYDALLQSVVEDTWDIRNKSNTLFDVESATPQAYMEMEALHYDAALSITESSSEEGQPAQGALRCTIKAGKIIDADTVLCCAAGDIVDEAEEPKDSAVGILLLQAAMRAHLQLILDPRSIAAHLQLASETKPANARIVTVWSLTEAPDSPLKKKHVLTSGALVVVAEKVINFGEEIVLEWPRGSNGIPAAPAPINMVTKVVEASKSRGRGSKNEAPGDAKCYWRMPGDAQRVAIGNEDAEDEDQPSRNDYLKLQSSFDPGADIAKIVNGLLAVKMQRSMRESFINVAKVCLEYLQGHDEGILPHGVWKEKLLGGAVLQLTEAVEAADEKNVEATHAKQWVPKLNALINNPPTLRDRIKMCEKGEGDDMGEADLPAHSADNEFFDLPTGNAVTAKQWSDRFATKEVIAQHRPTMVNLAYCSRLMRVASTAATREGLSQQAQQIAKYPVGTLINTLPLSRSEYPASSACLRAWRDALFCVLRGSELFKCLKDAAGKDKQFQAWAIVKSLAAVRSRFLMRVVRSTHTHVERF